MNSIKRLQSTTNYEINTNVNIYNNYLKKLINRYENYDYTQFENSELIYNNLVEKLKNYEINKSGKKTMIHGDPVFTNIIINQYGKIKFIDMRGMQDPELTLCGDWLYDWAKFYQSLIGYDEILLDKEININYKNKMINLFESNFLKYTSGLPNGANPITLYSPSLGLNPKNAVIVEYNIPRELGKSIESFFIIFPFLPSDIVIVSHSPTPSTVNIAACLKGLV